MKIVCLFVFSLLISCSTFQSPTNSRNDGYNDSYEYISIMQGATTETDTVLNFIAPKIANYKYKILDDSDKDITLKSKITKVYSRKYSEWKVVEVKVSDLKPNVQYKFKVELRVGKYKDEDTRLFKTLDMKKEKYKLLIASCMADSYHKIGDKAWGTVGDKDLDAFFIIGDIVYADYFNGRYLGIKASDMRHIWSRYIDSRFKLKLYQLKNLKPVFATWDDHDLGINNGDKTYDKLGQVSKVFRSFFPIFEDQYINKGRGVGFKLSLGSNNFFFLDNRSFRDKSKNGFHLGKKQTNWIVDHANKSSNLNWLIQGDQFFGGYHKHESFEGNHPKKFKIFLAKLKKSMKKYVFISGDRHLYEFMKIDADDIGHATYEITTSAFHAKIFPNGGSKIENKRRVKVIDNKYNSVILNIEKNNTYVDAIDESGKVLDNQSLLLN